MNSHNDTMQVRRPASRQEYTVSQYGRQWSIFAATSRCHVLFGSEQRMRQRCAELNAEDRK